LVKKESLRTGGQGVKGNNAGQLRVQQVGIGRRERHGGWTVDLARKAMECTHAVLKQRQHDKAPLTVIGEWWGV
jgi:hypothetical protein